MSLERVSARKAVALPDSSHTEGSSTIIDKIFDAEGTSWLVVDVAPIHDNGRNGGVHHRPSTLHPSAAQWRQAAVK